MKEDRRTFAKKSAKWLIAFLAFFGLEELVRRHWRELKLEGNRIGRRIKEQGNGGASSQGEATEQREPERRPSRQLTSEEEKAYATYLESFAFRYITPREIILPHYRSRNGVNNVLPPQEMWDRLPPTLAVADEIRHRLGVKLLGITSAYRSPEYNAQCPGAASRSYHTRNMALDLIYDCPTQEVYDMAEQLRQEGFFKGGIGLYNSFVHIDTRGRNATWGSVS